MKPLVIAFTLLVSVFTTTTSFANPTDVAPLALKSFNKTFNGATGATWTYENNLYKVQFAVNGQYANAYYDADGAMVVMTRNISSTQLPMALQSSVKGDCDNSWISDVVEVTSDEGVQYFVTLESADQKVILKSASATKWAVYQKASK